MGSGQTQTILPDWAFKAIASHALDTLIDRTEHEVIIVTRRGQPDVVLIGHEEWKRLKMAAQRDTKADDDGKEAHA